MMMKIEEIIMSELVGAEEKNEKGLPPGFRFHPTDEELITFYLASKVFNASFSAVHIAEVDLNRCEPWELPEVAKMGEREWYFFSLRDRKYPTGLRTNRATGSGYWKATGKDREVYSSGSGRGLLGMKKTLVFYRGRAPRGEKTKWVMHEYRLDGDFSYRHTCKEEWVICRIFHKMGEKKIPNGGQSHPHLGEGIFTSSPTSSTKPLQSMVVQQSTIPSTRNHPQPQYPNFQFGNKSTLNPLGNTGISTTAAAAATYQATTTTALPINATNNSSSGCTNVAAAAALVKSLLSSNQQDYGNSDWFPTTPVSKQGKDHPLQQAVLPNANMRMWDKLTSTHYEPPLWFGEGFESAMDLSTTPGGGTRLGADGTMCLSSGAGFHDQMVAVLPGLKVATDSWGFDV